MILVSCNVLDGILMDLKISGHAKGRSSVEVCAGVSCLSRTVCEIVSRMGDVFSKCETTGPGDIVLEIHNVKKTVQGRMSGVTDFLLFGIIGLVRDYPDTVKLKINNKEWYDGSQKRWW